MLMDHGAEMSTSVKITRVKGEEEEYRRRNLRNLSPTSARSSASTARSRSGTLVVWHPLPARGWKEKDHVRRGAGRRRAVSGAAVPPRPGSFGKWLRCPRKERLLRFSGSVPAVSAPAATSAPPGSPERSRQPPLGLRKQLGPESPSHPRASVACVLRAPLVFPPLFQRPTVHGGSHLASLTGLTAQRSSDHPDLAVRVLEKWPGLGLTR